MTRYLALVAGVLAMVGCASSRTESQEASAATTTAPPATSTLPTRSTVPTRTTSGARDQVNADLASTRARLQEAQRELAAARSEWSVADGEARSAQAQMDGAKRLTDSVAQARAAELTRAAETHLDTATTHLDYANKLVAARQADVDAAQLHVRTVEASGEAAASIPGSKPTDQRLMDAQRAETVARQRASELGRAALDAQRAWEDAARLARGEGGSADVTTSGTGSTSSEPAPAGR